MNQRQVLTGAVNAGDSCYSVGSVEGVPFTAYTAGCNIVILASTFERVQIIPGIVYGNVQVTCLDCATDVGKIAAAYGRQVLIFEPTPVLSNNYAHKLNYKWIQTAVIDTEQPPSVLSWNLEGTKLLTGSTNITLWHLNSPKSASTPARIDEKICAKCEQEECNCNVAAIPTVIDSVHAESLDGHDLQWKSVWQCSTASNVCFLSFSPDGTLFVSAGKNDRLAKIWYRSAAHNDYSSDANSVIGSELMQKRTAGKKQNTLNYTFVYIAHPRAITGICWRKTSKYMPKSSVANMLVTSCKDNICRLWIQTLLPDDGLVNFNSIEGLEHHTTPRAHTTRHRQKIMQRIRTMKHFTQFRRRHEAVVDIETEDVEYVGQSRPIPTLPSSYSVHDFHCFGIHGSAMLPGIHFHLAASINAKSDIPLVPRLDDEAIDSPNDNVTHPLFVMHWLNNKEMVFTQEAEKLLQNVSRKVFLDENTDSGNISADEIDDCNSDCSGFGLDGEDSTDNLRTSDTEHDNQSTVHTTGGGRLLPQRSGKRHRCTKHSKILNHITTDLIENNEDSFSKENSAHGSIPIKQPAGTTVSCLGDFIDRKFEALLRQWHSSYDLLFAIHPIDGSLLVWLVEWLDESCPGSFRQAQVSFSSRIPNAIPLGDALTMSHNVRLYSPLSHLDLRSIISPKSSSADQNLPGAGNQNETTTASQRTEDSNEAEKILQEEIKEETLKFVPTVDDTGTQPLTPTLCMVTKHHNGSLNLWHIGFAEKSNFTQLLSISHRNRCCGHRFRVNDVSCHPVLPLLLTTSHHNVPGGKRPNERQVSEETTSEYSSNGKDLDASRAAGSQLFGIPNAGFCSELILWKVDSVGPLSRSGGVSELARINSPNISAFANVAWIPTLLPSWTLGSVSNSPSACFIASDGAQLHVYQAVIDARALLAELNAVDPPAPLDSSGSFDGETLNDIRKINRDRLRNTFKVVSSQSTARPGCILQLDSIGEASHDWQNTQLLHTFQAQMIRSDLTAYKSWHEKQSTGAPSSLFEPGLDAVVDLRNADVFEEPFYLVLLEKTERQQSLLHMWRLVIASHDSDNYFDDEADKTGNPFGFEKDTFTTSHEYGGQSPSFGHRRQSRVRVGASLDDQTPTVSPLRIRTSKVCTQALPLPEDVEVVHAAPAAGHLSSSNVYPACFAPYLLCTACSDGSIRFWKCLVKEKDGAEQATEYEWEEWEFAIGERRSSLIQLPGLPLYVSCAYNGRIACAYKDGNSYSRPTSHSPDKRFINVNLSIFECESTGGCEWMLEDTIHLKQILIPQSDRLIQFELGPLIDTSLRNRKTADTLIQKLSSQDDPTSEHIERLLSVPSYSTMQSLKRIISEQGNQCTLTQKSVVQLDWVSTEDGSHVLTVSVGNKISVLTPVSTDIAQANLQAMKASMKTGGAGSNKRTLLKQASSMVAPLNAPEDVRWMSLRTIELQTADGLPPLPMQMSWVRDGILVVGMDSEIHVYTQWKCAQGVKDTSLLESRVLTEKGLFTHAQESQIRLPNHTAAVNSADRTTTAAVPEKSDSDPLSQLPDFGIFEASRLACPVLPQYHPKQLMELLAFGKVQRVKAILNNLVSSLCSLDSVQNGLRKSGRFFDSDRSTRSWSRTRTLSLAGQPLSPNPLDLDSSAAAIPDDLQLDYTEITSIRPLPLFALLNAEQEKCNKPSSHLKTIDGDTQSNGYDTLFANQTRSQVEETLDEILGKSSYNFNAKAKKVEKIALTDFGPRQAAILSKLLTHSHLPGLSSLDQMHLLALADAIGSFNGGINTEAPDECGVSPDSLDDCGLRFLLTLRQHSYLLCCLPLLQRKQLQRQGLSSQHLVWAFHSETQEELVQLLPCVQKKAPKWGELRELGVGWWIRNNVLLRRLAEQLAKANFQANQDPLDAALFYLAMKKKSLVCGLFRSIGDKRMTDFFRNDFTDDKWRKAALKNAFALLGKQRFEHAAAFFLLAGSLWDAVEVCLNKMDDLQLAMVLVRLYDGDVEQVPTALKRILNQQVLGYRAEMETFDSHFAHPDPFLRSMARWILQDYSGSLNTLLELDVGISHPKCSSDSERSDQSFGPSVFNFYLYLRTRPLLLRQQISSRKGARALLQDSGSTDAVTPFERRLFFLTAHQHFRAGCPSLALEVLSRLPNRITIDDSTQSESLVFSPTSSLPTSMPAETKQEISTAFDWGAPVAQQISTQDSADAFDWGAPVSNQLTRKDSGFKIELSDSEPEAEEDDVGKAAADNQAQDDDEEEDGGLRMKLMIGADDEDKPELGDKLSDDGQRLDIMAQQLRFIACLKILMEELSTLATGFEVDGGQLRYHLYVWLEKSVQALRCLCNYRTFAMRWQDTESQLIGERPAALLADDDQTPTETQAESTGPNAASNLGQIGGFGEYKPTLHEILLADKLDFEVKLQRAARRKKWLQSNESLLRTLLSYCSLHGAHGGGLAAVRMELILLLQELQQQRTQHQLLSPLPFPTTLPLLAASVACQKTVIADPIKHLHASTHDILESIADLSSPPLQLPSNYSEIYVLRDLGISLSACVYQSLCDADCLQSKAQTSSETARPNQQRHLLTTGHPTVSRQLTGGSDSSGYAYSGSVGAQSGASNLTGQPSLNACIVDPIEPISEPVKWPGVQSLRALLARDKDEDAPKLHTLLCEAYVAVYLSQVLFAIAAYDSHVLFRLCSVQFDVRSWGQLFGGGARRILHVPIKSSDRSTTAASISSEETTDLSMNLLNAFSKQRRNLHMKFLQQLNQDKNVTSTTLTTGETAGGKDSKTNNYREQFVPPQMSIVAYLMARPQLPDEFILLDYDSSESVQSEPEDDEFDEFGEFNEDDLDDDPWANREQHQRRKERQTTYELYAWAIMRKASLLMAKQHIEQFLTISGLELHDLPTVSPLLHTLFKVLDRWMEYLHVHLCSFIDAPFVNFLPNPYLQSGECSPGGPAIGKYKALLELNNTPFRTHNSTSRSAKRLWNYLVRQEIAQPIFIRYIFGKRKILGNEPTNIVFESQLTSGVNAVEADSEEPATNSNPLSLHPTRIVHKDQDMISAFCVNQSNPSFISLATPKEIQELNISVLLGPVPWLEQQAEYDILNLLR